MLSRILVAAAPLLLVGAAPAGGMLHIEVGNVRAATGRVHVHLCTEAEYLRDCVVAREAPARVGVTVVTLSGLKPGRYAAQVYYDQNGNDRIDRALFGIPREGVGFSNDAKITFSAPKFDAAAFTYGGRETTIRLRLRYFIGPNAPSPHPPR